MSYIQFNIDMSQNNEVVPHATYYCIQAYKFYYLYVICTTYLVYGRECLTIQNWFWYERLETFWDEDLPLSIEHENLRGIQKQSASFVPVKTENKKKCYV